MKALLMTGLVLVGLMGSAAAGAGSARPDRIAATVTVPRVVGFRLDRATRTLNKAGLRVNEECSGLFGCIVKSQWVVCTQDRRPGTRLPKYTVVVVYAERTRADC